MDAGDPPYAQLLRRMRWRDSRKRPSDRRRSTRAWCRRFRANDPDRYEAAGRFAYARGRYANAAQAFRATREGNLRVNRGMFDLAQTYMKLSQPDSARVVFEQSRILAGPFACTGRELSSRDVSALGSSTRRKAIARRRGIRTRS